MALAAADPLGADPAGADPAGADAPPPDDGVGVALALHAATIDKAAMAATAPRRRDRSINKSSSPSGATDGVRARDNA